MIYTSYFAKLKELENHNMDSLWNGRRIGIMTIT